MNFEESDLLQTQLAKLVQAGHIQPVRIAEDENLPFWIKPGVLAETENVDMKRFDQLQEVFSSIDQVALGKNHWEEWQQLASNWAEFTALMYKPSLKLNEDKNNLKEKQQKLDSDFQLIEYKLKELGSKLSDAKEIRGKLSKVGKDKDRYREIIEQINKFSVESSKVNFEVNELYNKQVGLKEELARLRISATATQEILQRDRAISAIQNNSGVFGTVAELGKELPNETYSMKRPSGEWSCTSRIHDNFIFFHSLLFIINI